MVERCIFNREDLEEALGDNRSHKQSLRARYNFVFIEGNCHTSGEVLDEKSF